MGASKMPASSAAILNTEIFAAREMLYLILKNASRRHINGPCTQQRAYTYPLKYTKL